MYCRTFRMYMNLVKCFCHRNDTYQNQGQMLCDPCLSGNIQTEATSFCQTCKDPEAFCGDCALQHTRQRATKGHEICSDMKQYTFLHNDFQG